MPTGLQEPKKRGFEISLATELWFSFSPLKIKGSFDIEQLKPQLNRQVAHVSLSLHSYLTIVVYKQFSVYSPLFLVFVFHFIG